MIWTLFWRPEANRKNIVEEAHPEFIKYHWSDETSQNMAYINCSDWKSTIRMYRDIWRQRIDEVGYKAPMKDVMIMKNVPPIWQDSPRPPGGLRFVRGRKDS